MSIQRFIFCFCISLLHAALCMAIETPAVQPALALAAQVIEASMSITVEQLKPARAALQNGLAQLSSKPYGKNEAARLTALLEKISLLEQGLTAQLSQVRSLLKPFNVRVNLHALSPAYTQYLTSAHTLYTGALQALSEALALGSSHSDPGHVRADAQELMANIQARDALIKAQLGAHS